jgi:hypothetical protein
MPTEKESPRASSRSMLRTCALIAVGAFTAGIACTALIALPLRSLPAEDTATTGDATPSVFALASDDKATVGAADSKPTEIACEDQVWPRFSPACLARNGEPARPVRLIERNRLAESTPPPRRERPVIRGRETLGIATPAPSPQVQPLPDAPVATPAEPPRRAKRSRKSRERDVARTREARPGEHVDQLSARRPAAPAHGQSVSPAMAYAQERTRRAPPAEPLQSFAYPPVPRY